jgi:glucose/arabinose dehydrogenase
MMCSAKIRVLLAAGVLWVSVPGTELRAETPRESDYYPITTFEIPEGEVLEAGAFQRMPDGRLAVATRRGEIWMIRNPLAEEVSAEQFQRYAHGLHEPLGLALREDWLYVTQRPDISRLRDTNGDGRADRFEVVAEGWEISGDYHEYAFGSKFDAAGNQWVVLCLTGSFGSNVPYRGWCLRVSADGTVTPTCSGIRSPGGIGFNADEDVFYTDNQGPWNGTCGLKHLVPGKFMGHPAGLRWYELAAETLGPAPEKPRDNSRMIEEADRLDALEPTAVMFPYDKMGKSASGIACDTTGGRFGPFGGQLFVGDQSNSTVMRVYLEKVRGHYQGACFPFLEGFASGNVALEMDASGALFVGGTNRGWGSRGPRPFAIQRVDWTGKVPFEIEQMRAVPGGFDLVFTEAVAPESARDPASYRLQSYTYIYREQYGSPEVDHTTPQITAIEVLDDNRRVRLQIDGLRRGHVHELHADGVRSSQGLPLLHPEAYYTLNYLPES